MALKEKFRNWGNDELSMKEGIEFTNATTGNMWDEDYTDLLLSHAQFYVFVEKYDIGALQKVALAKLWHTLSTYTLYKQRYNDIITLIRYVFAETAVNMQSDQNMRSMLMFYVCTEMERLEDQGEIKEMLAEDPDMMGDFMRIFTQKINEKNVV